MPYRVYWEKCGLRVVYTGQVGDVEIAALARDAQADERFEQLRYVLHDFRACEAAFFSHHVVEELAATDGAASLTNPRIRIAVVSDRDDVIAMAKAYMAVEPHGFPTRIFTHMDHARAWLEAGLSR